MRPAKPRRWFVFTNEGRKVTWAKSAQAAAKKGASWGLTVSRVLPAPSLLEQMETERGRELPQTALAGDDAGGGTGLQ